MWVRFHNNFEQNIIEVILFTIYKLRFKGHYLLWYKYKYIIYFDPNYMDFQNNPYNIML